MSSGGDCDTAHSVAAASSAARWIEMFETLSARFRCRSVEVLVSYGNNAGGHGGVAAATDGSSGEEGMASEIYFIGGPGGKWLAEVTSVTLERCEKEPKARLADHSRNAILKLVRWYELTQQPRRMKTLGEEKENNEDYYYEIMFDWFCLRRNRSSDWPTSACVTSSGTKFRRVQSQNDINGSLRYLKMMCDINCTDDEKNLNAATRKNIVESGSDSDNNIGCAKLVHDDTVMRENRQCFLRLDRNNRIITLIVLGNTTSKQELPTISIACNPTISECSRPFALMLACELFSRGITYDVINLHHTTEESGCCSRNNANASSNCWISKARALYKFAKWLRIVKYDDNDSNAASLSFIRDRIVCARSQSGQIRMFWRDGYIFPRASSTQTTVSPSLSSSVFSAFVPTVHLLPIDATIDVSSLTREIRRDERHVLSLCDFDVFHRRCSSIMASYLYDRKCGFVTATQRSRSHESEYEASQWREARYFVNSNNDLVSRLYVSLS